MKIIGLIGGMSWESSLEYYRIINEVVRHRLGGTHSARSIMYSVNFDEIEQLQNSGEWEKLEAIMIDAALSLEKAGANLIVICTNTMHKAAAKIQERVSIPLLHIVDPTAKRIKSVGINKIALLGTKYTMEQEFYKGRLIEKHGLDVILPDKNDRQIIHDIIYRELVLGEMKDGSREKLIAIITNLKQKGAEGVILGCTEIGMLIKKEDVEIPIFDTTELHAIAAVDFVL